MVVNFNVAVNEITAKLNSSLNFFQSHSSDVIIFVTWQICRFKCLVDLMKVYMNQSLAHKSEYQRACHAMLYGIAKAIQSSFIYIHL